MIDCTLTVSVCSLHLDHLSLYQLKLQAVIFLTKNIKTLGSFIQRELFLDGILVSLSHLNLTRSHNLQLGIQSFEIFGLSVYLSLALQHFRLEFIDLTPIMI